MARKPTRLVTLGVFAAIAPGLLAFTAETRQQTMHGSSGGVRYGLMPDGKWHRTASELATTSFDFSSHVEVSRGPGWEKWTATQSSTLARGPDPKMSASQAESFRRSVWQEDVDFLNENPQWPDRDLHLTGAEMLRDQVGTRVIGWTYYARQVTLWLGAFMGLVVLCLGVERMWLRSRAQSVLDRTSNGLCGQCKYPVPAEPSGRQVCSECGVDVDADIARAQQVIGRVRAS